MKTLKNTIFGFKDNKLPFVNGTGTNNEVICEDKELTNILANKLSRRKQVPCFPSPSGGERKNKKKQKLEEKLTFACAIIYIVNKVKKALRHRQILQNFLLTIYLTRTIVTQ